MTNSTLNYSPKKLGRYDNSHSCGNCNGSGCRVCFGDLLNPATGNLWQLRGQGNERFPLSRATNSCKPPYIHNPYAWKLHPRSAAHIIYEHIIRNHNNVVVEAVAVAKPHYVQINLRPVNPFRSFIDAVEFAIKWNGVLLTPIESI